MIGPTLLDLELYANTKTSVITHILTVRSAGGIVGAICIVYLAEKFDKWLMYGVFVGLQGITFALAPLCSNIIPMLVLFGIYGFMTVGSDTGMKRKSIYKIYHIYFYSNINLQLKSNPYCKPVLTQ